MTIVGIGAIQSHSRSRVALFSYYGGVEGGYHGKGDLNRPASGGAKQWVTIREQSDVAIGRGMVAIRAGRIQ